MVLLSLVGSKSVERILFFLLVNGSCYANQLQKMLGFPLTPIQKALERLEKGGILFSLNHGKTKTYQFNPHCPFLTSLQALLNDAYQCLPLLEKKKYLATYHIEKQKHELVYQVWERLKKIKMVEFKGMLLPKMEILGVGKGQVQVTQNFNSLIYDELGDFNSFTYKNCLKWTFHKHEGMITLEHLRHGKENPVFLFHLSPKEANVLQSLQPHFCGKDTYLGILHLKPHKISLTWRIMGPKKNEEITYFYS